MTEIRIDAAQDSPQVSIIIACYNAAGFIGETLTSVLAQSLRDIEVIVADDASTDSSPELVRRFAEADDRVLFLEADRNGGPAAARNRAFARARGKWIAVVDSDDLLHPQRLEQLVGIARKRNADIIADDLLFFPLSRSDGVQTLFGTARYRVPEFVSGEYLIRTEASGSGLPKLGYLKPIFRRDLIRNIRYNEALKVGEDFDFLMRLLFSGARLTLCDAPLYFYRRHGGSISHRLSEAKVQAMIDAHVAFCATMPTVSPLARLALDARLNLLEQKASFERLVSAMKRRNAGIAMREVARHPGNISRLLRSARERFARRDKATDAAPMRELTLLTSHSSDAAIIQRAASLVDFSGPAKTIVVPPAAKDGADPQYARHIVQSIRAQAQGNGPLVAYGNDGFHAACFIPERQFTALLRVEGEDDGLAVETAKRLGIACLE